MDFNTEPGPASGVRGRTGNLWTHEVDLPRDQDQQAHWRSLSRDGGRQTVRWASWAALWELDGPLEPVVIFHAVGAP
jgi:hypothetical protein